MTRSDEDDEALVQVTADDPTFNVMLYGEPFAGKTTLAASAQDHPAMQNVAFANIEGGLLSVAHRGDLLKRDIRSMEDLERFFWAVAKGEGRYESIRTIVLDNVTELQTINLEEITVEAIKSGKNKVKNRDRTKDEPWREDYGRSTVQLKRIFRGFRDLPLNVIFVAHAKNVYPKVPEGTDLTNVEPIAVIPSLTEKLGRAVVGYMDFVWYLEYDPDDSRRRMLTVPQGPYFAKTRGPHFLDAIGNIVEEPDLPSLYDTFVETATNPTPKKKRRRQS